MTEADVRKECNLRPHELINTNLGLLDLMSVNNKNEAVIGILATGKIVTEPVKSFITRIKNFKREEDATSNII